MAGYSPISDILSFGKSKKYSDKIMSNIINIDLTEDKKGIIFTTQDGVSFTVFFPYTLHEHSNLDILERININDSGELTFDGKSIKGDIFVKDDYYNKAEIDNRITSIAKGMSWKENVSTKTELENLENNSKGDARIVDEESNIYVFNGESWDKVGSSINIPNATSENDGLLSKEYFIKINKLDDDFVKNTEYNTLKRDIIAEQTELLTEDKTIKGSINEILNSVNNNMSSIINVEKNINDLFLVKDEFNSIIEKESVSFANEFIDGNIDIQTGELIDNEENIKYVRNKSTIIIGKESVISLQYSKENDLFTDVIVFAYTNENYIGNAELNMTTDNIDKYYNILLPENTNNIKIVFKIADERIQSDYVTLANSIDIKLNKLYIKEYNIKRFDDLNTSIKDLKTLTKSKNLFDGHFEKGYLNALNGSLINVAKNKCARTKYFIAIDDSIENVTIQRFDEQKLISNTLVLAYDSERKFIKKLNLKRFSIDNKLCHNIALTNDVKFIKIAFIIPADKIGDDYLDYFNSINFQIENGLEATEYAPHKLFVKKDKIEGFNDLEEKVNELFTSVSNGKNLLETAITDKGGTVSKSGNIATFNELKNGIYTIKSSKTPPTNWMAILNDCPLPLEGASCCKYGDYIFLVGGTDNTGNCPGNYCYIYNYKTNVWYKHYIYNIGYYSYSPNCLIDNKWYIFGGYRCSDSAQTTKSLVCTLNTNLSSISSCEILTSMPYKTCMVNAIYYNGNIYILGGWNSGVGYIKYMQIYNINTNSWRSVNIDIINCASSSIFYNDKIYYIDGFTHDSNGIKFTNNKTVYAFDILTNTISSVSITTNNNNNNLASTFVLNDELYIISGTKLDDSGAFTTSLTNVVRKFNPSTKTFTILTSIPKPKVGMATCKVDDLVYCIGGNSSGNIVNIGNTDYSKIDGQIQVYYPE